MKQVLILFLVLAGMLTTTPVAGQAALRGTITDAETGDPLIGANIVVDGTVNGTTTGIDGTFELVLPHPLPLLLRVTYIGYAMAELEVSDAGSPLHIELEPRILSQGSIVVSASRRAEKITDAPAAVSVLFGRDLEGQTTASPAEILRNVVGVDVSEQGINSYTVTLRGRNLAFDTATRILIDNRHATTPGLAVTIFGREPLNPDDLERVEVIRGPGSALYGPGVDAGVIHFITKNPFDHPGTSVSVAGGGQSSYRVTGTHRGLAGPKLGYKVSAMYSRADNWAYDPNDPADAAILDVISDSIFSGVDGSLYDVIDGIDPETYSYSATGSVVYRFDPTTSLTAEAGYSWYKGINRFTLGEIFTNFPQIYGQLRLSRGSLFLQANYLNAANDERTFLYRTGRTLAFNNRKYQLQAQHAATVSSIGTSLTYGGDYQLVTTNTQGTINGMFEDDDETVQFGVYAQSQTDLTPRLSLTLAGRVDRFQTIEQTVFSPRAGLVFQPGPGHSIRLTFNRAFAAPTNLSLYTDVVVADLAEADPSFADLEGSGDVRLVGGSVPITFDEAPVTVSFVPGVGSYDGMGMPLGVAYAVALEQISGDLPAALLQFLQSKADQITGFSAGIPFDVQEGVGTIRERNYLLEPRQTDMVELGYTAVAPRFLFSASAYYTWVRTFESDVRIFSPLVIALNMGRDLPEAVDAVVSDAELSTLGIDRETLLSWFSEAGGALSEMPVGLVQPDQVPVTGRPQLVGSFVNYGKIEYMGVELSATALLTDRVSATANFTGLSQIDFMGKDLGLDETSQDRYALNVPQYSYGLKVDYGTGTEGLFASAAYRHKSAFDGDFGELFDGEINEQNIVDLAVGYGLSNGIRFNVTAQNVFDHRYRSFPGLPKIGRLVLASVRYSF